MTLYELASDKIHPLLETTFADADVRERTDLQRLLRYQIEIVSPDTLIISEEFGDWEDSRRRIDLLGIDKDANLVVIELKRTEDGGRMELQAIRYAAMVSAMEFDLAVDVYQAYLDRNQRKEDARKGILDFLQWDEPIEEKFAQEVRIMLVSAEFSKELTTSVLWLNEHGLDLTCVRLRPYRDGNRILLDVQQVIPIPEAEAYQVKIRQKQVRERESRRTPRENERIDLVVNGMPIENLPKRKAILQIVKHLCASGLSPDEITQVADLKRKIFRSVSGTVGSSEFERLAREAGNFDPIRYFWEDTDLIHSQGKTWAFSNQWGKETVATMKRLLDAFPDKGIVLQTLD